MSLSCFAGLPESERVDREPRSRVFEAVLGRESGQTHLYEEDERMLDLPLPTDDHDQVRPNALCQLMS